MLTPLIEDDENKENGDILTLLLEEKLYSDMTSCELCQEIAVIALPLALTGIISTMGNFGDGYIAKNLGNQVVEASSYISYIKGIFYYSPLGVFTAIQPLASHYNSESSFVEIGIIWQNSVLLGICMSTPIMLVLALSVEISLSTMGQNNILSSLASDYFLYNIYSVPAAFAIDCTYQFLISVKMQNLVILISILQASLQLIFTFVFVYTTELGIRGRACANLMQTWMSFIIIILYMKLDQQRFNKFCLFSLYCHRPDITTFRERREKMWADFKLITQISPSIVLQLLAISITRMVNALLLGHSSKEILAAYSIAGQYFSLDFAVIVPFATAGCILTARAISKNDSIAIKKIACMTLFLGIAVPLFLLIFLTTFPQKLTMLFLNAKEADSQFIINYAEKVLPIVGINAVIYAPILICSGVYRGYRKAIFPMFMSILGVAIIGFGAGLSIWYTTGSSNSMAMGELIRFCFTVVALLTGLGLKVRYPANDASEESDFDETSGKGYRKLSSTVEFLPEEKLESERYNPLQEHETSLLPCSSPSI